MFSVYIYFNGINKTTTKFEQAFNKYTSRFQKSGYDEFYSDVHTYILVEKPFAKNIIQFYTELFNSGTLLYKKYHKILY